MTEHQTTEQPLGKNGDGQCAIEHDSEQQSNKVRRDLVNVEPKSLRTFTPSMAVIDKSAGAYHWTLEGRRLMDMSSGVLVANLGHNPTSWWRRFVEYLGVNKLSDQRGEYVSAAPLTAYNAVTPLEVQASKRLLDLMQSQPGGARMQRVMWAASGSEAIQKALWAALRWAGGRNKIIATRNGFHGKKGLAGAVTGCESDPERDDRVRFVSFPHQECINVVRRTEPIDLEPYRKELQQFSDEIGDSICCLITEPYLGGGGSLHPQPEYLQLLQQFCREHNALFILDEIQANFGRTGTLFAYSRYGVEPDVVCLGKGLGNGVPVSAAVGAAEVIDCLGYGEGSDTWSANPMSTAGVLATLDEFAAEDIIAQGQAVSEVLQEGLLKLLETGVIAHVRGEGCVWGIECQAVGNRSAEQIANECVRAAYLGDAQGFAIHLLGPLAGRVIRISPPLTTPVGELREHLEALFRIFTRVAQG
ncbi:MAG: aspartate aminotransferase family protein [Pirellulaceae bacterium]